MAGILYGVGNQHKNELYKQVKLSIRNGTPHEVLQKHWKKGKLNILWAEVQSYCDKQHRK